MGELGEQLERIIENYLEKWEPTARDSHREPAPDFGASTVEVSQEYLQSLRDALLYLRQECRTLLSKYGVPSNPAWSEHDIVHALESKFRELYGEMCKHMHRVEQMAEHIGSATDHDLRDQIEHLRAVVKERDQQLRDCASDSKDLQSTIELQRRQLRLHHERDANRAQRDSEEEGQGEASDSGQDGELSFDELWQLHEVRHGVIAADQEKIAKRLELLELSAGDFALEIRSVITRLNKRISVLEEGSPDVTKGRPGSV